MPTKLKLKPREEAAAAQRHELVSRWKKVNYARAQLGSPPLTFEEYRRAIYRALTKTTEGQTGEDHGTAG